MARAFSEAELEVAALLCTGSRLRDLILLGQNGVPGSGVSGLEPGAVTTLEYASIGPQDHPGGPSDSTVQTSGPRAGEGRKHAEEQAVEGAELGVRHTGDHGQAFRGPRTLQAP